jgi:2-polyprenyl-6-methoxyphenol hydroxylase-like FAD-dependent oxidoreductase
MALPPVGTASAEPERRAPDVDAEVLIVGAGPVGCWLAAELCAAGVRVIVIEARESRAAWSRGFVVHPRTLEIFDSRGAAQPLLEAGRRLPTWHFAMGSRRLDFTALPSAFPFVLIQPQARTEELLEEHLKRHGGSVRRGERALDLVQHAGHVAVRVLRDGAEQTLTANFVVGCDGARSAVRQGAGIGFNGSPDTMVGPHALVTLADPPPPEQYIQTREQGLFFAIPLPDGRFVVSTVDHAVMHELETPWTAEMVRASLLRITGTDYGMGEPERITTIGNSTSQADRYRDHRVLLAGDAAHVHYPMGGQGMNLGIQDAHNLAWRLTDAVRAERGRPGTAALSDALLDGYEAERRPVGERVLVDVRAQMALVAATGADGAALRSRVEELLFEHPEVNLRYALRLSGLDVRYPGPEGADPRLGARIPDLLLDLSGSAFDLPSVPRSAAGTRLYDLLRVIGAGRSTRLSLSGGADGAAASDEQVVNVGARSVLGPSWALRAGWGRAETVLIRPDGHVAEISALAAPPVSAAPGAEPAAPPRPDQGEPRGVIKP